MYTVMTRRVRISMRREFYTLLPEESQSFRRPKPCPTTSMLFVTFWLMRAVHLPVSRPLYVDETFAAIRYSRRFATHLFRVYFENIS